MVEFVQRHQEHISISERPVISCTLVGSFRFMDKFNELNRSLTSIGAGVLAPPIANVTGVENGFKLLDADSDLPPHLGESEFLGSLLRSDFGYIVNPGGYIGAHGTTETAIALMHGVKMFSSELIDPKLDPDSFEWTRFIGQIEVCPFEKLLRKIQDPLDKIHSLTFQAQRELSKKAVEDMALYVMASDFLKYKGLGYLVSEVRRHSRHFLVTDYRRSDVRI